MTLSSCAPSRHSCVGRNPGERRRSFVLGVPDGAASAHGENVGCLEARRGLRDRVDSCLRRNDGFGGDACRPAAPAAPPPPAPPADHIEWSAESDPRLTLSPTRPQTAPTSAPRPTDPRLSLPVYRRVVASISPLSQASTYGGSGSAGSMTEGLSCRAASQLERREGKTCHQAAPLVPFAGDALLEGESTSHHLAAALICAPQPSRSSRPARPRAPQLRSMLPTSSSCPHSTEGALLACRNYSM